MGAFTDCVGVRMKRKFKGRQDRWRNLKNICTGSWSEHGVFEENGKHKINK